MAWTRLRLWYGQVTFTEDDYLRLWDVLHRNHYLKLLLTYDNHLVMRDLYGWVHTDNREWN